MITRNRHPLPGETINGATVVASVVYDDNDPTAIRFTLLTLNATQPYFRVQIVASTPDGTYTTEEFSDHDNIVPAVEAYQQAGGDY